MYRTSMPPIENSFYWVSHCKHYIGFTFLTKIPYLGTLFRIPCNGFSCGCSHINIGNTAIQLFSCEKHKK